MCLIIDANLAARVFATETGTLSADYAPLIRWLEKGGCVVFGGKLTEELCRVAGVKRYLLQLLRAGRARFVSATAIEEEEDRIRALDLVQSNDFHVLALARASGARTLCSADQLLHRDFRNRRLISNPRGSVYQSARHWRLLKHTKSCGR